MNNLNLFFEEDQLEDVRQRVIERAAEIMATNLMAESEHAARRHVRERAEIKVSAALDNIVQEATDRAFQPVNVWGEPVGESTTISDMIAEKVERYWKEKVDREGLSTNSSYGKPRAQYYAEKALADVLYGSFNKEFRQYLGEGKQKISEAIADVIAKEINRKW